MMLRLIKFLLPFLIIITSCTSEKINDFEVAKSKWQSSNINDYKITQKINCFCFGVLAWDLYVSNGIKEKVEYDEPEYYTGETYDDVLAKAKTIDDVFDFIESLDAKQQIYSLDIEYDHEYGFPKSISIDYNENEADDEITYSYYNFEPLP